MTTSPLRYWTIALVGGLCFFYNFFQMTLFNPLAPALMDFFKIDAVEFGSINSGFFLAVGLMALPAGMIADKIRTKPLLLALTFATVANVVITANISDPALLSISRIVQGIIHSFGMVLPLKLATQWVPAKRLAMASSLIVTIGLLGGAASQPLMTYSLTHSGLHQSLLIDAYLGIGILILFALVIRDNEAFWQKHRSPSLSDYFQGLHSSLLNPQNWIGAIYILFLNLPVALLGATWGQLYMEHTWGQQPEMGSFIISLIFMGVIIGGPLIGMISDAVGNRKGPLIVGSGLSVLILGFILLTSSLSPLMLGTLFFMLGMANSSQVLVYAMVAESNPPRSTGISLSILTFVIMIGNALANMIFSATVSGTQYTAESFQPGMWMIWGAIALSLLAIALMRETFKRS